MRGEIESRELMLRRKERGGRFAVGSSDCERGALAGRVRSGEERGKHSIAGASAMRYEATVGARHIESLRHAAAALSRASTPVRLISLY